MVDEKEFTFDVDLKFSNSISAETEEKAKERLIDLYDEEYGLTITNDEITSTN